MVILLVWVLISWLMFCFVELVDDVVPIPSGDTQVEKPVLFIHFHKAGGTSIISTFQKSHLYNSFPGGGNGLVETYLPTSYTYNKGIRDYCRQYYPTFNQTQKNINNTNRFDREIYNLDYYTCWFQIKIFLYTKIPLFSWFKNILFDPNCFQVSSDGEKYSVPWVSYNNINLKKFLRYLKIQNVNFISSEFHFYDNTKIYLYQIQPFKKMSIFTMIRDPYKRFVSYYYYTDTRKRFNHVISQFEIDINLFYYLGHPYSKDKARQYSLSIDKYKNISLSDWKCIQQIFRYENLGHTNFYIRYLNGYIDINKNLNTKLKIKMNSVHLNNSISILNTFDCVAILELPQTWKIIENKYNVKLNRVSNQRVYTSNFLKNFIPTKQFELQYKQENELDYQFYHFAINRSKFFL